MKLTENEIKGLLDYHRSKYAVACLEKDKYIKEGKFDAHKDSIYTVGYHLRRIKKLEKKLKKLKKLKNGEKTQKKGKKDEK